MSFSRKDFFYLFLILVIWAGNIVAIKLAVQEVPPMIAATLRFVAGGLLFLPFIQKPDKRTLWTVFQISIFMNVIHIGLLFVALKMLDAASVSILLQLQVVFSTILGALFFKESFHWRTWSGISLAFLGVTVMIGEPDLASHPLGIGIMVVSTISLAFSYVKMKQLQSVHPATYVCLMCLCAVPFSLLISLVTVPEGWAALPNINWMLFGPVLAYQALIVSLTHIAWQRLMHRGDVGKMSAYTLMIPFMAIIMSVVFLGEDISWPTVVGGIITMVGVGIITLRRIQKGIPDPIRTAQS